MFLLNRYVYYAVLFGPMLILSTLSSARVLTSVGFVMGLIAWSAYQQIVILERRRQVYRHKITTLVINYEKSLADARVEMQELALRNISKELHDNIKMSMAVANLQLTSLHTASTEEQKASMINAAIEKIASAYNDLNSLVLTSNTDVIIQEGLVASIGKELDIIRQTKRFDIDFKIHGNGKFEDSERQLMIFRIVQESLQNILKHADASFIRVYIQYNKYVLELMVQDNGNGFESSQIDKIRKAGLANLQNRVNALEGYMSIHSRNGGGTAIRVSIPYKSSIKRKIGQYRWYHHVIDFVRDRFA